ncbi:Sphingomyelin phosphodiesterase 2 [Mactra antiquata]
MSCIFWTLSVLLVFSVLHVHQASGRRRFQNPRRPGKSTFAPFKTLTYNAALTDNAWSQTNFSNNRLERRSALIDYLQYSDSDVVCLQEVYICEDIEAIVNGLSQRYPFSYSQLHLFNGILPPQATGLRAPACDLADRRALLVCLATASCSLNQGLPTLIGCLNTNCRPQLQNLVLKGGTKCLLCLLTEDITTPTSKCASANVAVGLRDMNTAGLVLLSKKTLTNRLYVPFYQGAVQNLERGYLQAMVDGKLTVACTHLYFIAPTSSEPILSQFFPSADVQNEFEVFDLITRLKKINPAMILGDFNIGPRGMNYLPIEEERFNVLTKEYKSDVVDECTFCQSNAYNVGRSDNCAIDHIFGKGRLWISKAKVVLKENDAFVTTDGRQLPLSDHYGVEALVTYFPAATPIGYTHNRRSLP